MAEQSRLFRKVALDRLSSPEQLDTLMRITTPNGWVALLSIIGLLTLTVLWGIFGAIPTKVLGQGILVRSGGVLEVESTVAGQLTDLVVSPGDEIYQGQVFARIAQKELLEQLSQAQRHLDEMEREKREQSLLLEKGTTLQLKALQQERVAVESRIASLRSEVKRLATRVRDQEALVKDGLITKDTLAQTLLALAQANNEIVTASAQLKQLSAKESEAQRQQTAEQVALEQRLRDARRQAALLQERLFNTSRVVAPHSGRVVEVMANEGNLLQPGSPIISIERIGRDVADLEMVAYLSPLDGKKVHPGMTMQIVPSIVKKEEYGSLLGKVVWVADFPATQQGMLRALGNRELVQTMSAQGPPIEVRGNLIPDPTTTSRYRWTSDDGPPLRLDTGIICSVSIVTREQPPITLAIPLLKEFFGL
jgi:HlyD family secretion protein